jgi:hypothetical protein
VLFTRISSPSVRRQLDQQCFDEIVRRWVGKCGMNSFKLPLFDVSSMVQKLNRECSLYLLAAVIHYFCTKINEDAIV